MLRRSWASREEGAVVMLQAQEDYMKIAAVYSQRTDVV
jgi:hypothetical protein